MPIAVAAPFSATVSAAGVVTRGVEAGPMLSVAVPTDAAPDGSVTLYLKVEVTPAAPAVGLNPSPVSCATVRLWPTAIAVTPSARTTVPSVGRFVTAIARLDEA